MPLRHHLVFSLLWQLSLRCCEALPFHAAKLTWVSGDEAAVCHRIQELLANGLDELVLQLVYVVSQTQEQTPLLQLVGSLQDHCRYWTNVLWPLFTVCNANTLASSIHL